MSELFGRILEKVGKRIISWNTYELVSFLAKFIAGSLKFVKDQAINCFKISWSLCCRGVFTTFLGVWDRASRENSHQLKTVDCFPRNPRLKCLTEFLICPCVIRYCPPWKRKIFNNLIFDFLLFFYFICL